MKKLPEYLPIVMVAAFFAGEERNLVKKTAEAPEASGKFGARDARISTEERFWGHFELRNQIEKEYVRKGRIDRVRGYGETLQSLIGSGALEARKSHLWLYEIRVSSLVGSLAQINRSADENKLKAWLSTLDSLELSAMTELPGSHVAVFRGR